MGVRVGGNWTAITHLVGSPHSSTSRCASVHVHGVVGIRVSRVGEYVGIQALRNVLRGCECKPKRVCGCARNVVGLHQRVMGELGHPHANRGGAYCASGRIMGAHTIASGVYRGHPGIA